MRNILDRLVLQYKTPAYIPQDPIQIPWRFADDPKACELVAFLTALFSYGRRDLIIESVNTLLRIADNDPVGFMESFNPKRDAKLFRHFVYRFNKGADVAFLWQRLQWAYQEFGSLEALFSASMHSSDSNETDLKGGIGNFTDRLLGEKPLPSYGLKFLFAHPDRGGACKRFNMFLRWMVRKDPEPESRVDFGLWRQALQPKYLIIPLDTHILKMNKALGLSRRNTGCWQTAEEITGVFRHLCPDDPVKYDYALFGFSQGGRSPEEILEGWQGRAGK